MCKTSINDLLNVQNPMNVPSEAVVSLAAGGWPLRPAGEDGGSVAEGEEGPRSPAGPAGPGEQIPAGCAAAR